MTAETAASEITTFIGEIVDMLALGSLDKDRLRQIDIRVSRLAKLSYFPECDMIRFLVAFGLGDRVAAEAWIETALKNDVLVNKGMLFNAANVLANLGTLDKSLELTLKIVDRYPNDPQTMLVASSLCERVGAIFLSRDYYGTYMDLAAPERKMTSRTYLQSVRECDLAEHLGLSEHDVMSRCKTGVNTVRAKGREVLRQGRMSLDDGSFVHELYVDADVSQCADLNFDIADALADEYENPGTGLFSITCRPFSHYSLRNESLEL